MEKPFVIIAFLFTSIVLHGQQFPDYDTITLRTKQEFTAEVDKTALGAANYLLATPIEGDSVQRLKAAKFLYRWMNGSPVYSFTLTEPAGKISKANNKMMTIYLAGMAKYSLEHPSAKDDKKKVKLNAAKTVLAYCRKYKITMDGELKKMNEAEERGELEKYLGI
jgi:hypothetical protein